MSLPTDNASRKRLQIWTWLMEYFPDAILEMVEVSIAGNEQWNPGEPLHWAREKSTDQMNTALRHMWDHGRGTKKDIDGRYHLGKAAWRVCAELQLQIEKDRAAALLPAVTDDYPRGRLFGDQGPLVPVEIGENTTALMQRSDIGIPGRDPRIPSRDADEGASASGF